MKTQALQGFISQHISYKEATYSRTAIKNGIDNTPDYLTEARMKILAQKVFEPLRKYVNAPIIVASFYRNKKLNKILGGAENSQHTKGEAMDLVVHAGDRTNADMFNFIKENLDFDQLIWEFGTSENPSWVHVSYSTGNNRKEVLRAYKNIYGKTKYRTYDLV